MKINRKYVEASIFILIYLFAIYLWTLPFQDNRIPYGEFDAISHWELGDYIAQNDRTFLYLPPFLDYSYGKDNKFKPQITCPKPIYVDCGTDLEALNLGTPSVIYNCDYQLAGDPISEDLNNCGVGTATKTWKVLVGGNVVKTCSQRIYVENNTPFISQAYERRKSLDDFTAVVNKRWKMGYDLIDIEYGEGNYCGIFVKGSPNRGQALTVRSRWYDMARVIASKWKKGYSITNIEFTLGRWMTLFSKLEKTKSQGFETAESIEAFEKVFKKRQKAGYEMVDMAEGW